MAGEDEATAAGDPLPPARPVLFTYQKRKSRVLFPSPESRRIASKSSDKADLSLCYSCGLSYNNIGPNRESKSICILKSEWRILLLCKPCLSRVRSGDFCSYCLQSRPDDVAIADVAALEFLQCVKCSCRVHRCCLSREHCRDFSTWHKLGEAGKKDSTFTCIDCTPVPAVSLRSKNGTVLELISEEIDADVAFGVLSEKKDDDLNMAIEVHLAINGSQRVSKKTLNSSSKLKKCEAEMSRKKRQSFNPNRVNHRGINENLNGIKYGPGSVVLALESVKAIKAPFMKERVFNEDLKKMDQNEDLSKTGTTNSNLNDRFEIKYKRKKLLLLGELTGTERKNCVNFLNCSESRERKTGTEGNQDEKDRYEKTYKRRKCIEM